jgi:cobalt-zinc-cadmium efflux system membrane fusion protein
MNRSTLFCMAAAALLGGCSRPPQDAAAPGPQVSGHQLAFAEAREPVGVRTAVVGSDAAPTLTVTGRLGWDEDRTTRVFAPFAGRIERLRVAAGEPVRRGQALADLASGDIGQAQADLHKAQADLALARANRERAHELADGGVIAQKDLQQAEADLARASAEAARAQARLAQYGVAARSITQAFALAAPLGGVVVERNGNPGMEVRPDVQGPPLFTISDPAQLWATLDVDEAQLGAFRPGQALQLESAAWPGQRFPATVMWVSESVDPTTRTVKVRARVPNPERKLKAEMFVSARAALPSTLPAVAADAVFQNGGRASVFVQQAPGRYERRDVQVRSAGPATWLVTQGLAPGERVVVSGSLYLNQLMDARK